MSYRINIFLALLIFLLLAACTPEGELPKPSDDVIVDSPAPPSPPPVGGVEPIAPLLPPVEEPVVEVEPVPVATPVPVIIVAPPPTPVPPVPVQVPDLRCLSMSYEEPYVKGVFLNQGAGVVNHSFVVELSKNGGQSSRQEIGETLDPGEQREIKFHIDSIGRPTGTTSQFTLRLDLNAEIIESLENNNQLTTSLAIPYLVLPEFKAVSLNFEGEIMTLSYQFTKLPGQYFQGKTFSIGVWVGEKLEYQIENRAADQYDAVHIIRGISIPGDTGIKEMRAPIPLEFASFRGKEYRFAVLLDHSYELFESYRQDNWLEIPHILNPLPGESADQMPDLEMDQAYLIMNGTYLTVRVRNHGPHLSLGNGLRFRFTVERCGDSALSDAWQVPLGDFVQFSIPVSKLPGLGQNCPTRFTLDPQNLISEANEQNNVFELSSLLIPGPQAPAYPDLLMQTLWIQREPSYVTLTVSYLMPRYLEQTPQVRMKVERCGQTAYSRFLTLTPNMDLFGLGLFGDEIPGRGLTCLTTITLDPDNFVRESNETNNVMTGMMYFY
ncbi:MAG: hypothetical protein A2X86_14595 [Bdellovibrionales bacterium GWA2_49_15]|nr:MAG: hypothetical protein A2X86_14595 [Bdellovibrionales bacterium GWA2_49_15]HAZ13431.1 hypothetical protein [Bdellovibrionales bacterium]